MLHIHINFRLMQRGVPATTMAAQRGVQVQQTYRQIICSLVAKHV